MDFTTYLDDIDSLNSSVDRKAFLDLANEVGAPDSNSEEWKYSEIESQLTDDLKLGTLNDEPTSFVYEGDFSAKIYLNNGWTKSIDVNPGWENKGLKIVAKPWEKAEPSEDYFSLLNQALHPEVVSISLDADVVCDEPIIIINYLSEGVASFPKIEINIAKNSKLLVCEIQTDSEVDQGLVVSNNHVNLAENSVLEYLQLQNFSSSVNQIVNQRTEVAENGSYEKYFACFGAGYNRSQDITYLSGYNSSGKNSTFYYSDKSQVHDFKITQHHIGRNTKSNLLFKGAVDDFSKSIYSGLIKIHPDAAGSQAEQTSRNIKLSDDAWSWAVPNLEIENNDVRCSHASTISDIDHEQRFYLESRGINPDKVTNLIIDGFYKDIIERLPISEFKDLTRSALDEKLLPGKESRDNL